MSLQLSGLILLFPLVTLKKQNTPKLKNILFSSAVISLCRCQQWWWIWQTIALVSQHVCNVPFIHITAYPTLHWLWHKRLVAFKASRSPVYASFLCCELIVSQSCSLFLVLRTHQREVPQSGLTLSRMYMLCSPSTFYIGMRISSAVHVHLVLDIFQWTQRWNKDNRMHPRWICGANTAS